MEAMDSDPMDSDPDGFVFDLRAELFELLDDLKELKYSCVHDVVGFLENTRDDEAHALISKLRRKKDRMQLLKTHLIENLRPALSLRRSWGQSLHKETYPVHSLRLNRQPLNSHRGLLTRHAEQCKNNLPESFKSSHFSL
jgi:hypothetical protein